MFSPIFSKKGPLAPKALSFFFMLCLVIGTAAFVGCKTGNDPIVDDNKLNPGLAGTWKASGDGWTDTYIITLAESTIEHPDSYSSWKVADIVWVYNFSETSGCLIVKYSDNGAAKYSAVYFKDLTGTSVLLGNAYTVADYTIDPAVNTLDEAKTKFAPANASLYGGAEAQGGEPQIKQQTE
jgi:hypothetical protein